MDQDQSCPHLRQVSPVTAAVAYHPPRSPTGPLLLDQFMSTVDMLRGRYGSAKFVICGDLNELDTLDVTTHVCLSQAVQFSTQGQNTLES